VGGRDTESQVERRLRPLRGRQRHRESGGKRFRPLSKRQRHRESGGKQSRPLSKSKKDTESQVENG